MRTYTSPEEFEKIKIQILAEYEKTQVIAEIARKLNIPKSRMAHYARKLQLKGIGNNSSLTPELETKIKTEYAINPNLLAICKKLKLNYNTMKSHFNRMELKNIRSSNIIWVDDTHVECSKCSKVLLFDELETIRINNDRVTKISYCRECRTKQAIKNNNTSLDSYLANRIRGIRARSKTNKISFNLTTEYLLQIYNQQEGMCFYTGREMSIPVNDETRTSKYDALSVDKIIPSLGYVKGNVVLCSWRSNSIKGNMTLEEMSEWLPLWHKRLVLLISQ